MALTTEEKTKIAEGFKTAGQEITECKTAIEEMSNGFKELNKQLRNIRKGFQTGQTEDGKQYRRFWPTEEQAKEFGKLIIKAFHQKSMGETISATGGILIPEELSTRIIDKLGQYGKFRSNALVVPLGSDRQIVPKVETDLTIYAPGEGQTITDSDIEFSGVGLTLKKLCCLCKISSELEEDSLIAIGEIVGISMTRSIAKKEDAIGFVGDGTEIYFGMTGIVGALRGVDATIGNIKGLKVGTGNTYIELTLDDFEGVVAILPDDADDGAKWYVNRKFYFSVMYKLARAAGAADLFAILTDRRDRFFMGYPVEFVSAMPSTEADSQICALLGDLQLGAFLGQKRILQIDRSDQRYFEADQIGFRGIERIDINAYGVGDTSEAGPIVGLITAGT